MAEQFGAPELRLAQIDARAIMAWRQDWTAPHPTGVGHWDWERLVRRFRRDPASFTLAVWHGGLLCGLAAGHASERRASGDRAYVSINLVQSVPRRAHPLKRRIVLIAAEAVGEYGKAIGASSVRVVDPLDGAVAIYTTAGFNVVRSRGRIVSCEKEIVR
jgi:hypothetical protein